MTPNFLLHLSNDIIKLDQLAPNPTAGWVNLTTVTVVQDDFSAALTSVAQTAPADPDVCIVMPLDQIKLLTLDIPDLSRADVLQALEGQTPYPVDALAIDWRTINGSTYIAAIATETLAEARAFVQSNTFKVISFAALPSASWGDNFAFFGNGDAASDDITAPPVTPYVIVAPQTATPPSLQHNAMVAKPVRLDIGHESKTAPTVSSHKAAAKPVTPVHPNTDQIAALSAVKGPSSPVTKSPVMETRSAHIAAAATLYPKASPLRGKPKYLSLILTALLLLFMFAVGAWASTAGRDVVVSWFKPATKQDQQIAATVQQPAVPSVEFINMGTVPDLGFSDTAPNVGDTPIQVAANITSNVPVFPHPPHFPEAPASEIAYPMPTTASVSPARPIGAQIERAAMLTTVGNTDVGFSPVDHPNHILSEMPDAERYSPQLVTTTAPAPETAVETTIIQNATLSVLFESPPVSPPARPQNESAETQAASVRPRLRPTAAFENQQRQKLGGYTLSELRQYRPSSRPAAVVARARAAAAQAEQAKAAAELEASRPAPVSPMAVLISSRPNIRPKAVERAAAQAARSQPSTGSGPVARSGEVVRPSGATRATVARAATETRQLKLGRVALIGLSGRTSARRALVRLPNGTFVRVKIGDSLDGGRVAAIGDEQLRYIKSGRNISLQMP